MKRKDTLQERRQKFAQKLVKASTLNEDVMHRYYNDSSNGCRPILVEHITLDRIINKHGDNGYIAISACRSDCSTEDNEKNTIQLKQNIISKGYSFLPTYGGFRDVRTGEEADYEPSFIVFNYDNNGNPKDFNELFDLAINWCKMFRQCDVMIKAPNDIARYYTSDGIEDTSFEAKSGVFKNDAQKPYFTSLKDKDDVAVEVEQRLRSMYLRWLRKKNPSQQPKFNTDDFNQWKLDNADKLKEIGRRWTNNINYIGECYVNPIPCTLVEQMKRTGRGEVMIFL